ncbi:MAG: efflux RND transporter periplasmic adaptor subunit [Paracoccaceae bacterium]
MRIFPIITSIIVVVALYFFVLERDTLLAFSKDTSDEAPVSDETPEESADIEGVSVVALHSEAQTIQNGILLRGRTQAARRVDVRAEASGLVVSEPLRKGAHVEKGQLLCALDAGTIAAQLAEAKARLKDAEVNASNAADLAERGFGPETAVITARAALESAKAGISRIERNVANLKIHAPFAGFLETDTAEIGSLMQQGGLCATVIALDTIKLVGFATEQDINRIELGSMAGGRLVSGREVVGKVTFLSRASDPVSRTFQVEITVPNADTSIRDGETADIFIAIAGDKGHLLPQHVLTLNNEGRLGVRAAEGNLARFMPVEVLRDTPEGIWLQGLPEAVDVIVVGQEYVIDGSLITVTMQGPDE